MTERDTSSDPVDYRRDGSCAQCGAVGHWAADCPNVRRDISSVTGSAAEAFVADTDDYGKWAYMERPEIEARVAAIQREAVDPWRKAVRAYLDAPGEGAVKREAKVQLRALLEGKTDE